MNFTNKLNYKEDGHLILDEAVTIASSKIYTIKHHNIINESSLEVWTGLNKTGTKVVDFTLSKDTSKSWVSKITFGNGVASGTYYITYYSQGDKNDADDINNLQNEVKSLGNRVLTTYIHSGNKVVQPTSLNKTTGLFTTSTPIGLTAGTKREVITVTHSHLKVGILPREFKGIDAHYMEVVDNYNFYIQVNNTRLTYTNAGNNLIDVSAFHFEYDMPLRASLDVSSLKFKNWKVIVSGARGRAGWSYVSHNISHSEGADIVNNNGTIIDGRDMLTIYMEIFYSYDSTTGIFSSQTVRNMKTEWDETNGIFRTYHNIGATSANAFHVLVKNPVFTSLKIDFPVANGFMVKIIDEDVER